MKRKLLFKFLTSLIGLGCLIMMPINSAKADLVISGITVFIYPIAITTSSTDRFLFEKCYDKAKNRGTTTIMCPLMFLLDGNGVYQIADTNYNELTNQGLNSAEIEILAQQGRLELNQ